MTDEIDLKNSKLLLEGTPEEQDKLSKLIDKRKNYLSKDKDDRHSAYTMRRDFYVGNHAKYSNIVGIQKKEKQGHANAVLNYAGKTSQKIAQGMANNPPNVTFPVSFLYKPEDPDYSIEEARTRSVEDFSEMVMTRNKFWKRGYRRSSFNQSILGDYAIKVYPCNLGTADNPEWEIKVVSQEDMGNLLVGWRGDDAKEFDYVIAEEDKSIQSIEEEWGIKVPLEMATPTPDAKGSTGAHNNNAEWGQKNVGGATRSILPSGQTTIPSKKVYEYDDENVYAIKIGTQLVQMVKKDGKTFPKMKFWVLGENIPNPGSHWSIADIDFLIDPNIELNEASNEERDLIRVGTGQKYVATNMQDFDPESIKTGSGGVIFVNSSDGTSKFEPLQTNANSYPADTYLNRMKKHMHDLGVPEVAFGSAGSDSGRSKSLDYQSLVDLMVFKRDSWELSLTDVYERIQKLGFFYFKYDFFKDAKTGAYVTRYPEYDWSDVVPLTQSDKIVNVVNKVQMGLPFKLALKELGYRDVESVISEMKKEAKDPDLMTMRAKLWTLSPGIVQAQQQVDAANPNKGVVPPQVKIGVSADANTPAGQAILAQENMKVPSVSPQNTPSGDPNTPNPTLVPSQNDGGSMPMAQDGGTTAYSTPKGTMKMKAQNQMAQGK